MGEITWIKLRTDMFDNPKIRLIESLPEGDTLIVIWAKILTTAGKVNCSGYIMIAENIPMNVEEMSSIFNRPLNTVRLALQTFKRYGMIEIDENEIIRITNWDKHQNIDGMEKVKKQTAERVRKHREKKKLLALEEKSNVTVTLSNATESESDLESDLDLEKELEKDINKDHHRKREKTEENIKNDDDDDKFKLISNEFLSLKTKLDNKKAFLKQKDIDAINRIIESDLSTTRIIQLINNCFTYFKNNYEGTISSFVYVETYINNNKKSIFRPSRKIIRKEPELNFDTQQEQDIPQHTEAELEELREQLKNLRIKKKDD